MRTKPHITAQTVVPTGTYRVGDPCYSIANLPSTDWHDWLDAANAWDDDDGMLIGTIRDRLVVAFRTAYGDGTYRGSDGFWYSVDAGLLGLVPVDLPGLEPLRPDLTTIATFKQPTTVYATSDGTIHLGHISIRTGD